MQLKSTRFFKNSRKIKTLIKKRSFDFFIFAEQDIFVNEKDILFIKNLINNKNILNKGESMFEFENVPDLLTTRDLCSLLGVKRKFVDTRVKNGLLQTYKFGGGKINYFKKREVLKLLQKK